MSSDSLKTLLGKVLNGTHSEKLRFLIAGGVNTVVAYGLFALGLWLLTPLFGLWDSSPLIIQWITWVVGVPLATLNLKFFAFRAEGSFVPQILRSYLVYLPAQLAASALLALFTLVLGFHPLLGQLITLCIVTVFSYLGHKYFTFKQT
ncbi:MAG: GtrA family protein [Coriobacteriia bacterium]|nr:GtrA family protein [Coriobacteriia bacterium]MCL2746731.1 GtrA family protein [Coriobacteriia bacterium]MCL2870611.1 GtrA family protein [Coriobacteriia bacterium]